MESIDIARVNDIPFIVEKEVGQDDKTVGTI